MSTERKTQRVGFTEPVRPAENSIARAQQVREALDELDGILAAFGADIPEELAGLAVARDDIRRRYPRTS
jgi:hypothetical protein